jgi:restriction endonuclease S subunit
MRKGWTETALSALLSRSIGGVWGTEPETDQEEVTVVRSTEFTKNGFLNFATGVPRSIKSSQLSSRELAEGDILLEKSGGGPEQPVGRVVYVQSDIPPRFVCSNFIQLLTPVHQKVLPRFLFLVMWMWHFENKTLEYQAQTTGIRNLRTPDYLEQFIALPPLGEQKRIVDVVSSVDSYIAALQKQADSARTSRNAVLHELLSVGGDDWTGTTLGEVAEASWGNTTVTKKQYKESGFTAFSASGPDGFVDWFEHDGEGVVLSAIGALCGKTWLADGKWTPIKNTIWIKSISEDCLTKYLFLISKMPDLWPIRGQAQPFISLGDVRQVAALIPPLTEQKRIVEIASSMDEVIQSTEQAVLEAKNLRTGLLSDLLSGEHEIPESYDRLLGAA